MKIVQTCAALTFLISMPAMAATDGTQGSTSSGTLEVAMNLQPEPASEILITGLEDISFGTAVFGDNPADQTISDICVQASTATTYSINIASFNNGVPGTGSMIGTSVNGDNFAADYNWTYTDTAGTDVTGQNATGLQASSLSSECAPSDRSSLALSVVSIARSETAVWESEVTITDQLTLTVSPD